MCRLTGTRGGQTNSFCDCRVGEIQLAANLEPRERSQVV
ncbi:hypothetical protein NC651_020123 [Populus alba x Populus x berolinensis]|nr:hypothetical protein NC651_020123 [Populus alba x Populus x berolinensis]